MGRTLSTGSNASPKTPRFSQDTQEPKRASFNPDIEPPKRESESRASATLGPAQAEAVRGRRKTLSVASHDAPNGKRGTFLKKATRESAMIDLRRARCLTAEE